MARAVSVELSLGAHENALIWSEDLNELDWLKIRATIQHNAINALDGSLTADKLEQDATDANTHFVTSVAASITADATYTYSAHLKVGEDNWVLLNVLDLGGNGFESYFNLATGAEGTQGAIGTGTFTSAEVETLSGGWYRCSITGVFGSGQTVVNGSVYIAEADNDIIIATASEGDGFYVWGQQLEQAAAPTTYIYTSLFPLSFDWHDASSDIVSNQVISWKKGITGSDPQDLVAGPGRFEFTLDNGPKNSAGLAGLYSPGHANVRDGFGPETKARLRIGTPPGNAPYVISGRLKSISPSPGQFRAPITHCVASDYMDELEQNDKLDLALITNGNANSGMTALIAVMPEAPDSFQFDAGVGIFPFLFDDLGGLKSSATGVAQDLMQSEFGHLFERNNGVLVFQERNARLLLSSSETFTDDDIEDLTTPTSLDRLFNDVEAITYPRRLSGDPNGVVVELSGPVFVAAGEAVTISVEYEDTDNEGTWIGGTNMQQPSTAFDWSAWPSEAGGGIEQTADWTFVATFAGSSVSLVATNNGTVSGYLRGLGGVGNAQVRGQGIFQFAPESSNTTNGASIGIHGQRRLETPFDMPYETNPNIGHAVAELLTQLYGDIENVPTRVKLQTGIASIFDRALVLDIGHKITITETQTAVNADVIIHSIEGEVTHGRVVSLTFGLAPADTQEPFTLDHATRGKLDNVTYRLGYG